MKKSTTMPLVVTILLVVASLGVAQLLPAADEGDRAARVLANLKLKFPQLGQVQVTMNAFEPTDFEGLEQGSFTIVNRGRTQVQSFLVSTDDKQLYMISGEGIDVSRSAEEIEVELARRLEEETSKALDRRAELEAGIDDLPIRGNRDAKVTIVEFSDFQCPYCARGSKTMEEIIAKHDDVRFVFKHFPLGFHKWAKPAAIATHCAAAQSEEAFWQLHDAYFDNQKSITEQNVMEKTKSFLASASIDLDTWSECAEDSSSEAYQEAARVVDADMKLGQKHGVSGTPGFFVNGRFLNGAQPIAAFEPVIEEARKDS